MFCRNSDTTLQTTHWPFPFKLAHRRTELPAEIRKVFGCEVSFGSAVDEVIYPRTANNMATVNSDSYLNSLLVRCCEEALSRRREQSGAWRLKAENAIIPLLPHGQAKTEEIAKTLGVSKRTLARLLASEGCTFFGILDAMRLDLAKSYLREQNLQNSEIAWLLGFGEVSAFTHACKRWTGKTPTQLRYH